MFECDHEDLVRGVLVSTQGAKESWDRSDCRHRDLSKSRYPISVSLPHAGVELPTCEFDQHFQ